MKLKTYRVDFYYRSDLRDSKEVKAFSEIEAFAVACNQMHNEIKKEWIGELNDFYIRITHA